VYRFLLILRFLLLPFTMIHTPPPLLTHTSTLLPHRQVQMEWVQTPVRPAWLACHLLSAHIGNGVSWRLLIRTTTILPRRQVQISLSGQPPLSRQLLHRLPFVLLLRNPSPVSI
jgi:hypothetical protein